MAKNYFDQFDQTPEEEGNYFDQFDVVEQGGPRSFMSRTLDQINPEGAQRRAGQRQTMA